MVLRIIVVPRGDWDGVGGIFLKRYRRVIHQENPAKIAIYLGQIFDKPMDAMRSTRLYDWFSFCTTRIAKSANKAKKGCLGLKDQIRGSIFHEVVLNPLKKSLKND